MEIHADLPVSDTVHTQKWDQLRGHLSPLLILTSIFFINFISRIIPAPLMPKIEEELGIAHAAAGSFFLLISVGYFITLLCSGFFSSRLTHRRTIILSGSALGLALLGTTFSDGLWGLRTGIFITGMAAGLYLPSGLATLTAIIAPRHWGKAIAIHELAPNLSFIAAPVLAEALLIWFTWRAGFVLLGSVALLLTGIFIRFGRGGEFHGQAPSFSSFKALLSKPVFWILVVLFSLGISSSLGLYTMLPLYLVTEHGIERNWANSLVALSRVAGLVMTFVGGWLTDRFGPQRILMIVFFFTGLMTLCIGIAPKAWIAIPVFLQPMLAVSFFPAGLAALSLVSSEKERSIVVSFTVPIAFLIGGGAVPTLIGFIGDISTFASGIVLIGGIIITGTLITRFLKIDGSISK